MQYMPLINGKTNETFKQAFMSNGYIDVNIHFIHRGYCRSQILVQASKLKNSAQLSLCSVWLSLGIDKVRVSQNFPGGT